MTENKSFEYVLEEEMIKIVPKATKSFNRFIFPIHSTNKTSKF